MKKRLFILALVATALVMLAALVRTQPTAANNLTASTPAKHVAAADDSDINADALAALNSMGSYLRTLKAFQVEAVTTKDDVLDDAELPLEDLFYWGGPQSKVSEITGAIDVGPAEVGGVTCEQYAFRQPGLNWQIWIQQGEFPLPRKLVLSTLTDEARPQYSSVLQWNLAPSFNEAAFEFDPPSDAQKIVFAGEKASADGN